MIGFDRPLRPEWIHQSLRLWKPNTPLNEFYQDFDKITYQLYGNEGKRKTRTVLFRYFFDFKGRAPNQVTTEGNLLAEITQRTDLDQVKPLYLAALAIRSKTFLAMQKTILRLHSEEPINTQQLIEKSFSLYGERAVVKHSTRAFLTTLLYFGVLCRKGSKSVWRGKLPCSTEQLALVISFFCLEKGFVELHLEQIKGDVHLKLLDLTNMDDCAKKYNSKLWSFSRRPSTSKISLYPDLRELITRI